MAITFWFWIAAAEMFNLLLKLDFHWTGYSFFLSFLIVQTQLEVSQSV